MTPSSSCCMLLPFVGAEGAGLEGKPCSGFKRLVARTSLSSSVGGRRICRGKDGRPLPEMCPIAARVAGAAATSA